ncbi:DUF2149 domain-containing protein [Hydrogenobacter sp. T-2]|uniref:DUF2149 domain-containing protein n=1 Tax=Pampinifervens diazotrophicum TaxID=1632018 RepID=UPI002B2572DE|nr:DUF2149 domain-containing protein [Hydrogenobacter sp. T-2]WPM31351.1 DUF2149 domain-containing protein [Hydrogenobacter sp. T-2]
MNYKELVRQELERLEEETDPMLSVVNMIDAFLAVVIALLLVLVNSPFNPFTKEDYVLVKNPDKENMEILIKKGEKLERYVKTQSVGEGKGVKVGITYRLEDGTLIYVPEE